MTPDEADAEMVRRIEEYLRQQGHRPAPTASDPAPDALAEPPRPPPSPVLPQVPDAPLPAVTTAPPRLLTLQEFATYHHVSRRTIYQWIRDGRIPAPLRTPGGQPRFVHP